MSNIIDQYQAACLLAISPELLAYLTKNTVKKGDERKLQIAKRTGTILFFEEDELKAYNDWLFRPWPADLKKRPHLPNAIKEEVKAEASGECAICSKNGNSCEAAHIAPVSLTKCNHPHNLLWLCANHHTKFDNGSLGPKGVDNDLVKATKLVVQHARKYVWTQAVEVSTQIAALLKLAKDATGYLKNATSQSNVAVAEGIGEKVLELLSSATSKNKKQNLAPVISKISSALAKPNTSSYAVEPTMAEKLSMVAVFEDEFRFEAGLRDCPLCQGKRWHNEQECPVCQGEGNVGADLRIDLSPYELVTCRLCKGERCIDSCDCPACGGEGEFEARIDEQIDWSGFDKVSCRYCKGNQIINGNDCPACGGEGTLDARIDGQMDWSSFDKVSCRLCKGLRRIDGEECSACGGEGELEARIDEQMDWPSFNNVKCELCAGKREFRDRDCPVCNGEGELPRRVLDATDLSRYRDVNCPLCLGLGEFKDESCPECGGEGKMEEWRAGAVNVSDYQ
ncbi:HNH endonuclease [Janthinobacterium sp. SUN100]|uniref:HNH endonuclease n=1 Tax=Janthinobacterium sp. SUN100 TaxID=3004101 RepID=UPI0025AFDF51|nr:HNH endonuclease [Janthinobacterium sp. SUN100]MDN2702034.1 HNH endonuclease [Janthinobacterium sp. SUN100]